MDPSSSKKADNPEDLRRIPLWAARHARNRRAILVAIFIVIFLALFAAIGGFSRLAGIAFRTGRPVLGFCSMALALFACGALIFASVYHAVPKWGGKGLDRLFERLCGEEGAVVPPLLAEPKTPRWALWFIEIGFGACILATVILGFLGLIPEAYMQPVSALYSVPFLLFLSYELRAVAGLIPLLWPFLYALHAILIVAGAPILFRGKWDDLNMLLPTFGYGILTALIGYFYSRYALRKLKRLARIEPRGAGGEAEAAHVRES